jgi:hypothetical protein
MRRERGDRERCRNGENSTHHKLSHGIPPHSSLHLGPTHAASFVLQSDGSYVCTEQDLGRLLLRDVKVEPAGFYQPIPEGEELIRITTIVYVSWAEGFCSRACCRAKVAEALAP